MDDHGGKYTCTCTTKQLVTYMHGHGRRVATDMHVNGRTFISGIRLMGSILEHTCNSQVLLLIRVGQEVTVLLLIRVGL